MQINGTTTTTYVYDDANRIVTATTGTAITTYTHDAAGNRTKPSQSPHPAPRTPPRFRIPPSAFPHFHPSSFKLQTSSFSSPSPFSIPHSAFLPRPPSTNPRASPP
ncbi:MAG TPA: hypothetical protein VGN88_10605, partial [Phycisphaerae bacterium]